MALPWSPGPEEYTGGNDGFEDTDMKWKYAVDNIDDDSNIESRNHSLKVPQKNGYNNNNKNNKIKDISVKINNDNKDDYYYNTINDDNDDEIITIETLKQKSKKIQDNVYKTLGQNAALIMDEVRYVYEGINIICICTYIICGYIILFYVYILIYCF